LSARKGYILYAFDKRYLTEYANSALSWCGMGPLFSSVLGAFDPQPHLRCGRLAQSLEGGGKRGIFAIGNYMGPIKKFLDIPSITFSAYRAFVLRFSECNCGQCRIKINKEDLVLASSIVNSTLGLNIFSGQAGEYSFLYAWTTPTLRLLCLLF